MAFEIWDKIKEFFSDPYNTVYSECGVPILDSMLRPNSLDNPCLSVVLLKTKNPEINQFVENFKKEATKFGKIFQGTFGRYPSPAEAKPIEDFFEDVHILRPDEYNAAMAGWLPEISLKFTTYIGKKAHGILYDAAIALEEEQGSHSSSVNVFPANTIIAKWLRDSIDIFKNFPRVAEVKHTMKIYYKGPLKRISIYYFVFLTAIGCDILIDLNPNQKEVLTWVDSLPENMRVVKVI